MNTSITKEILEKLLSEPFKISFAGILQGFHSLFPFIRGKASMRRNQGALVLLNEGTHYFLRRFRQFGSYLDHVFHSDLLR